MFGAQKGLMQAVVELLLNAPHGNINWLSTSLHAAELLLVSSFFLLTNIRVLDLNESFFLSFLDNCRF